MNGNWYPWGVTSANAADYAAAFAHIATLAHNFPNALITVVWNPNVGNYTDAPMTSYYPGDAYVDDIGLDIYSTGAQDSSPMTASTGPTDIELSMIMAFAQQHNKPFALPETGAVPGDTAFPNNLAQVVAGGGVPVDYVGFWDYETTGIGWEWDTDPNSSAAWKAAYATMSQGSAAACSGSSSGQ
jgi:beta-mannanase